MAMTMKEARALRIGRCSSCDLRFIFFNGREKTCPFCEKGLDNTTRTGEGLWIDLTEKNYGKGFIRSSHTDKSKVEIHPIEYFRYMGWDRNYFKCS